MGESRARTTERSNSYQARSLTASDKSASASSPDNWAAGGGGGADPDAGGLSDSSLAESTSEGEERSPVGCSIVTGWYALSLKYSVSLIEGDLRSPRRLRRMIEPFIRSRRTRWWPHRKSGGTHLAVFLVGV